MSVPDYQSLMLPTLKALEGRGGVQLKEIRDLVAQAERLSSEDRREVRASGQSVFATRVWWAVKYMWHAGLIDRTRRGVYELTPAGHELLSSGLTRVDKQVLMGFPAFRAWLESSKPGPTPPEPNGAEPTPIEVVAEAVEGMRRLLEADVLERVRKAAPEFLEQVVVDLLIAMGYGGGDAEKGRVLGRPWDGGVDGKIREDLLGLDEVYVQAKRYAEGRPVGQSDLRDFAGAIDASGTTKGVFFTTSSFTRSALDYVEKSKSPKRIVLISGAELARLMVRHGVGVRTHMLHEVKRVDEDYFDQDSP